MMETKGYAYVGFEMFARLCKRLLCMCSAVAVASDLRVMIRAAASDELSFLHSAVPHIASSSGVSAQPCILPQPHTARSPLETLFSQHNPYAYQLLISRVSDRTIESLFVVRQQPLTATLSFDPIV